MHNDDIESLMKNANLHQLDTSVPEGITTTQPALMSAVEYLNHLFFGVEPIKALPERSFRSEETSKELIAKADAKRERKNAKRLSRLTNKT